MFGSRHGARVAAVAPRKHAILPALVIAALALLLVLLAGGSPIAASPAEPEEWPAGYGVMALHPGESMAVYCVNLKRAEFEETFRGGVVVWCRPELAAESYLPVVFKGPSRPWEIGYGE